MTPTETDALITKHLEGWLDAPANSPTLRERIAAMIAEAESARDKLWRDGAETLKHEKQYHMDAINRIAKAVDMLGCTSAQIAEDVAGAANSVVVASLLYPNVGTYIKQVEDQLAAMTAARDKAIAAAHLAVEPPAAREPRDLVLLIEKIQSIAPDLRDALEIIRVNAMYTAPEAMSVWWNATANALEMKAANHPERDQIQAIFGGTAP
jgi:hypothetical protein